MLKKFERWVRSKEGQRSLLGVLVLLLLVVVGGQLAGWWDIFGGPGAAGVPAPVYASPPGGYTCLPTCAVDDGKFLVVIGGNEASFSGSSVVLWVSVPGNTTSFDLSFFDGDSGKDATGAVNYRNRQGHWDNTNTEATYTLYPDPLKDGRPGTPIAVWRGNQDPMPDNDWFTATVNNVPAAKAPSGHYFYRLEITRPAEGGGFNAFKVRSTAYLSTGRSNVSGTAVGIIASIFTMGDFNILYPQSGGNLSNPGPSNYTGEWNVYFYVPNHQTELMLWDGDFDRGTSDVADPDLDDANTDNVVPSWAGPAARPEGAGAIGAPPDDIWYPIYRREPAVRYEFIDPLGQPVYVNDEPSGTEEWEKFLVSTDPSVNADLQVSQIKAGFYTLHITGLDVYNAVWVRLDYEIVPYCQDGPCKPPREWLEGTCPRTIGYWKNNVKKILIEGKTRGVQESRATLEWGLNNVALASPLFRSGINVSAPAPISTVARLTDAEANAILQKTAGNTMLDRALQQNLATWLNLATGKLGPTTVIHLVMPSGNFDGTVWQALQTAQNIILYERNNPARLEYAKDIADMINNNQLNADPSDVLPCEAYAQIIPPNQQPPAYDDMPEGPLPPAPPNPVPPAPPDPNNCGARLNNYNVEVTNNPFYGIKFNFQSGQEVKNGAYDLFQVTLPAEVVSGMTSVQLEAKAAGNVGILTLEGCDFTSALSCGQPVTDSNGFFAFYFIGATNNGNGTYTLTFQVQNLTRHGLSHATIGLPQGVTPIAPTNTYQSQVCPTE